MDQGTRLLGIYVLISLIVFCACVGTYYAYNNSKSKVTPTPMAQPVKAKSAAPAKSPTEPADVKPAARWTPYPGSGGVIKYRLEPLKP